MNNDASQSILHQLSVIHCKAKVFFKAVIEKFPEDPTGSSGRKVSWHRVETPDYWKSMAEPLKAEAAEIASQLVGLAQLTGPAIRRSPLLTEADERVAGHAFKGMRAALRLQMFQHEDVEVLHDEGTVLGVQPARDSFTDVSPSEAASFFEEWIDLLRSSLELANPQPLAGADATLNGAKPIAAGYRPDTAFIMMCMSSEPGLTDVNNTIKDCFGKFGVVAVRADDIEHEDIITQRILDEIKTAEFLIADLTNERPSVYYEVGYAHALGRRVMLYRKKGTQIHFDLAAFNCPEYENLTKLRQMLMKRIESVTGKSLSD
jgi:hypothetical protein